MNVFKAVLASVVTLQVLHIIFNKKKMLFSHVSRVDTSYVISVWRGSLFLRLSPFLSGDVHLCHNFVLRTAKA